MLCADGDAGSTHESRVPDELFMPMRCIHDHRIAYHRSRASHLALLLWTVVCVKWCKVTLPCRCLASAHSCKYTTGKHTGLKSWCLQGKLLGSVHKEDTYAPDSAAPEAEAIMTPDRPQPTAENHARHRSRHVYARDDALWSKSTRPQAYSPVAMNLNMLAAAQSGPDAVATSGPLVCAA